MRTIPPDLPATSGTPFAPVTASERLDVLDIMRGIALVGILLMNVEWFSRSIEELGKFDETLTGFDHAAGWLIRCFVEGKFYKIFSLLFGMGFAVMLIRAQEAGRPFVAWFMRRMVVLWCIGLLHFVFLFTGDILRDYALAGMLVLGWILLFRTRRLARFNHPRAFLKIALVVLLLPLIFATLAGLVYGVTHDPSDLEQRWSEERQIAAAVDERVQAAIDEGLGDIAEDDAASDADGDTADDESGEDVDEIEKSIASKVEKRLKQERRKQAEIDAFARGTYWQATVYRTQAAPRHFAFSPVFALLVLLPVFLVGYWFVASGTLRRHHEQRRLFVWMAIVGVTLGLPLEVGGLTVMQHPVAEIAPAVVAAGAAAFLLGQYVLSAGYVGLVVLASATARGHRWLLPFAPMGRMALTNYIMHSLILVLVFHAYGAGLFGQVPRAAQVLIVVAIIAFQLAVSAWWLKRFRFGPLEWLWRSLTYKSLQPMRLAA